MSLAYYVECYYWNIPKLTNQVPFLDKWVTTSTFWFWWTPRTTAASQPHGPKTKPYPNLQSSQSTSRILLLNMNGQPGIDKKFEKDSSW